MPVTQLVLCPSDPRLWPRGFFNPTERTDKFLGGKSLDLRDGEGRELTGPYSMGRYEVTFEEFGRFCETRVQAWAGRLESAKPAAVASATREAEADLRARIEKETRAGGAGGSPCSTVSEPARPTTGC